MDGGRRGSNRNRHTDRYLVTVTEPQRRHPVPIISLSAARRWDKRLLASPRSIRATDHTCTYMSSTLPPTTICGALVDERTLVGSRHPKWQIASGKLVDHRPPSDRTPATAGWRAWIGTRLARASCLPHANAMLDRFNCGTTYFDEQDRRFE